MARQPCLASGADRHLHAAGAEPVRWRATSRSVAAEGDAGISRPRGDRGELPRWTAAGRISGAVDRGEVAFSVRAAHWVSRFLSQPGSAGTAQRPVAGAAGHSLRTGRAGLRSLAAG